MSRAQSSRSSEDGAADGQHNIEIATDVFALVLIGEEVVAPWRFLMLALFCVTCQALVLYFIGTFNEYIFFEGVWLTPHHHQQWSLTFMRILCLMLSMLKASGEFANALALFQAIWLGRSPKRQTYFGCRIEAWVALVLQYVVGLLMLATCAQIALSESSPIWSLFKALSAWLVVDMDNFLAVYAVNVLDLHYLEWSWELSTNKALKLTGKKSLSSQGQRLSKTIGEQESHMGRLRSSWHMWQAPRPVSEHGEQTYLPRSKGARAVFFGVPTVLIVLEVALSLHYNVLPFTFITRGAVSNEDAPIMLLGSLGLPGGCCPPKEHPLEEAFSWNVSVLFLMPAQVKEMADPVSVEPPSVFWVATGGNNIAPSSLQVYDGHTAKGLTAGISDSKRAVRTQARHWLNNNGYPGDAGEKVYRALRTKPGLQLYKASLAYSADFQVSLPQESLQTYKVFVVAQNKRTWALAPEPVVSAPLHVATYGCPEGCRDCGDEPGLCDKCHVGKTWSRLKVACIDCAPQCNRCDSAGDGRCDEGSCAVGFGRTENGLCAACNVTGCAVCDSYGHVQVLDRQGGAFANSEAEVEEMAQRYQAVPIQAFPSTCDTCRYSYGLSKDKQQCKRCDDNCSNCSFRTVVLEPEVSHSFADHSHHPSTSSSMADPNINYNKSHTGHRSATIASTRFAPAAAGPDVTSASNATMDKPKKIDVCDCQECVAGHGRRMVSVSIRDSIRDVRYICQACVPNCAKCPKAYKCDECMLGFGYDSDKNMCKACPDGCRHCTHPKTCGRNDCRDGYGYYLGGCRRCQKHCNSCSFESRSPSDGNFEISGVTETCTNCTSGYGKTLLGGCGDCGDSCARCDNAGACTQCLDRFTLNKDLQRCEACADRCKYCDEAGAGQCDKDGCVDGFQVENITNSCIPIPVRVVSKVTN